MDRNWNLYQEILNHTYEAVYFVDRNRMITFWNKEAERITGFSADEIIGKYCYDNILNHVNDEGVHLCIAGCPLERTIYDGARRETKVYLQHKNGHRVAVLVKTIPILSNHEVIGGAEMFVEEHAIKGQRTELESLRVLALFDQLTQLPNRFSLEQELTSALAAYQKFDIPFGVLFLDVDFFKRVNDTYGHQAGDRVLQGIAVSLRQAFRTNDVVGRWGGEEFLILLRDIDAPRLMRLAEKARILVERTNTRNEEYDIAVTISIGASMMTKEENIATLLKRCDDALYQSKRKGRNTVTLL